MQSTGLFAAAIVLAGVVPAFSAGTTPLLPVGVELVPANVMSDTDQQGNVDGRGTVSDKAAELGLSEAEVEQIRQSTGFVACPGTTYGNPMVGTGALVGSNMQVITAVHLFIDELGRKREPRSDCYFLPQSDGVPIPATIPLDFASGNYRFGTDTKRKHGDASDWAVVALREPIAGAPPFGYDTTEPKRDDWIIVVSAFMSDLDLDESIVQECRVRGLQHLSKAPVQFITDCDVKAGASGGPALARDSSGELVVRGVVIATGEDALDGLPYDASTGSYTRVVGISGDFVWAIKKVQSELTKGGVTQ